MRDSFFLIGFTLVSLCVSSTMQAGVPGDAVQFTPLPAFHQRQNASWGPVLTDIMNHEAPGDNDAYDDQITLAHETSHGIHAYIRNHLNSTGKRANGFYVLENRAVIVEEPNLRKSAIAQFVPSNLHGFRYGTYLVEQTEWDDTPLYVWDEWNAYVNGGAAGVDQVQHNLWTGGSQDGVAGPLEFCVYALASAMAVQQYDPQYFEQNIQFREFLAFNVKRSMGVYLAGSILQPFQWNSQDRFYEDLKSSDSAQALRQFTKSLYGDAWVKETLGF